MKVAPAILETIYLSDKTLNINEIALKNRITYSAISKMVQLFKERNILDVVLIGREKKITLTKKGKELAKEITNINTIINST